MKEKRSPRRSKALKVLLTFVCAVSAGAAAVGSYASVLLYDKNYYGSDVEKLSHDLMNDICADDMYKLNQKFEMLRWEGYFDEKTSEQLRRQLYEGFMDGYSAADTNFMFTIHDMDDNLLVSSEGLSTDYQCSRVQVYSDTVYDRTELVMTEEEYGRFCAPDEANNLRVEVENVAEVETDVSYDTEPEEVKVQFDENGEPYIERYDDYGNFTVIRFNDDGEPYIAYEEAINSPRTDYLYHVSYEIPKIENAYYITGYVRSDLNARDRYSNIHNTVVTRYNYRYVFPTCAVGGTVLALACLIFLVASAGYSRAQEAPGATVFEKIPFDIFTAVILALSALSLMAANYVPDGYTAVAYLAGTGMLLMLLGLWWLVSIAMRLRTGTLLSNNLLTMLGKLIWKACCKTKQLAEEFCKAVPFIWQAAIAVPLWMFLNLFGIFLIESSVRVGAAFLILFYTATIILVMLGIWNLHILQKAGKSLAEGHFSEEIPEHKLIGSFRKHAQNLNSIGEGMNKAVSDRLKSEMFRTELISNVSHDIRTPLTSIINYTDLLAALELENAQAQEYITVLKRQSERLRKLTDDVLEASKATTGNVRITKETMDLRVLLEQMEGEYSGHFEEKRLTLIKDIPDVPQYISVDGRLMWRVMDNLFGNICKYAMEGTRVYLNMLPFDGEVICMLRNISGAQLGISAESLMERFVQGDRSRNTEGSGLGLSIAQSLTALQGGNLELQIDGDLFKVTLRFPSVPPPQTE